MGRRLYFAVPEGQRYSCQQCGNCCRWWRIEVDPAERDRILAHDWALENPRLEGLRLFEEQTLPGRAAPVVQTAQVEGQCVFLEDDNRCLIHRVLGLEAKPAVCQAFPLMLVQTVEGILASGNYACTSLARNEGEPFAEQEEFALKLLRPSPSDPEGGEVRPGDGLSAPEPLLSPSTPMAWGAYQELQRSLLEILGRHEFPATARLVALWALVSYARARWAGRGRVDLESVRDWLEERRAGGYTRSFAKAADLPSVPALRLRAVLAPLIADVETAPNGVRGRTSAAIGFAVSVVNGVGVLPLHTLKGRVDLAAMRRVGFDQDSPRFSDLLTRFLANFLLRQSLLESPTLTEGATYLCLHFALLRWYAVASAAMRGRTAVEEEDVVRAIQVVEKSYVHRMGLRSGFRKGLLGNLLKLEMEFLVPPAALVRSHQPTSS